MVADSRTNSVPDTILGAILAGGAATRMGAAAPGGDKCLIEIGGAPLLVHARARLAPQVAETILSANGDPARFDAYGLDVIADETPGQGPLAGVIAALAEAARRGHSLCLTVPGDAPLLPRDLAARLHEALGEANCAVATSAGQRQSVFALWRVAALARLRGIYADGTRALWRAQEALSATQADFADADAFLGLNRPADRTALATALNRAAG
ncbi:MAG: molybdenum cofactor guanylyltransferase MobA [Alphaproteobacteria bacterium]